MQTTWGGHVKRSGTGHKQSYKGVTMDRVLFSSKSDEWSTPQDIYDSLDSEFGFTLDPCATSENHKCGLYFTKKENGLLQDWGGIRYFAIHHIAA